MNELSFDNLRFANTKRLPEFKNKHGQPAHAKPDGSDWSPAEWFQALIGEVGEFAQVRLDYEAGRISDMEYQIKAAKELADVQTYLDILAMRAFDKAPTHQGFSHDVAGRLMELMTAIGDFANSRKKVLRGDMAPSEFEEEAIDQINTAMCFCDAILKKIEQGDRIRITTTEAHPTGVDLGQATVDKFNEVSKRVDSTVRISENGRGVWFKP